MIIVKTFVMNAEMYVPTVQNFVRIAINVKTASIFATTVGSIVLIAKIIAMTAILAKNV